MKISVVCPVLNEVDFIGYSIMAGLPYIHEYIYALDEESHDGTRELLWHLKEKYAHEKLVIINTPNFHPHDMGAYVFASRYADYERPKARFRKSGMVG